MRTHAIVVDLVTSLLLVTPSGALSQGSIGPGASEKYEWDLSHLIQSQEEWDRRVRHTEDLIGTIGECEGTVGQSASRLLMCLERNAAILQELRRLSEYRRAKQLVAARDPQTRLLSNDFNRILRTYNDATEFVLPEIFELDQAAIARFLDSEPGLHSFRFYLHDLSRQRAHRRIRSEERLIAEAQVMSQAPSSIYLALINELHHAEVQIGTGEMFRLDPRGFRRRLANLPEGGDRALVIERFTEVAERDSRILGAVLNARMNSDFFQTRARGYTDALEMILAPDNFPVAVYHNLIAAAHANLDTFHRYLSLRKRILGVDTLRYVDLAIPYQTGMHEEYAPEAAQRLILESLSPMGEEYASIATQAFENRWIEWYSDRSNGLGLRGAYAEHPYILLPNYSGTYESVKTLTHELGHALHRYIADRTQPFPNTFFHTSIVEVPALFHEILLKKRALDSAVDDESRLFLLLATVESSFFNRARWAEFELLIHREVENGNALTGEVISRIYVELLREYFGHDEGVCSVADVFSTEWIDDFLIFVRSYGIYRYAVARAVATILGERVLDGDRQAVEDYLEYLAAGGSDYPSNLLAIAGVDVTSPGLFQRTIASMEKAMDEIESILDRTGR